MRTIKEVINESKEWNPNGFKSHRCLKYMNEDEIVDMLKVIIQDIKDHELNELKG